MSPYDAVVNGFVCIGTLILDIFWHKGQPRIKAITSERMPSHMLLERLNLARVRSTPRCPTLELCIWLNLRYVSWLIFLGTTSKASSSSFGSVSRLRYSVDRGPSISSSMVRNWFLSETAQSLEKSSVTTFLTPSMYFLSKSNAWRYKSQRRTLSLPLSRVSVLFLWSVHQAKRTFL